MQGFTSVQKMAEDSTPVPRGSLDEYFIEQQQNALKQLTVQYEDLEDKVELIDCFFTQLDGNQEENRGNLEKLEKRVTELEVRMYKVEDDVELAVDQDALDEGDRKIDLMEERISVLKIQNIELREHLNLAIDTLNNIVKILNSQVINEEEPTDEAATPHEENPDGELLYPKQDMEEDTQHTLKKVYAKYEVTTPHEDMDEDTQPSLRQVYAMYQSQPPDEEGWDEMTSAIEAAEEREARKKVNGLTKDEWQDLLHLK